MMMCHFIDELTNIIFLNYFYFASNYRLGSNRITPVILGITLFYLIVITYTWS